MNSLQIVIRCLVLSILCLISGLMPVYAEAPIGRVIDITQRVQVTSAGNDEVFKPLLEGKPLWLGDTVYTRRTGRATVSLGNGTLV
jgi:hypothetical protein